MLLSKAADQGITPLHIAMSQGMLSRVEILLDKGASKLLCVTALKVILRIAYKACLIFLFQTKNCMSAVLPDPVLSS